MTGRGRNVEVKEYEWTDPEADSLETLVYDDCDENELSEDTEQPSRRTLPRFAIEDESCDPIQGVSTRSASYLDADRLLQKPDYKSMMQHIAERDTDGSLANIHKIRSRLPELDELKVSEDDAVLYLARNIIYRKDGLIALNKPYGLSCTMGQGRTYSVSSLLPALARLVAPKSPYLHLLNRLDKHVTGVLLVATNKTLASEFAEMYVARRVRKHYVCITKGVPEPNEARITIPLCRARIGNMTKTVPAVGYRAENSETVKPALTNYFVRRAGNKCALVQCSALTGYKHQIRSHMGLGIDCPILGDHKYSALPPIGSGERAKGGQRTRAQSPVQRLPDEMLRMLGIRSTKTRHLPMYLHASELIVPEYKNAQNLVIRASLPKYFMYTMKKLRLML